MLQKNKLGWRPYTKIRCPYGEESPSHTIVVSIPSGKQPHNYGKSPFLNNFNGKTPLKIFKNGDFP
jgi:hypothetical protein